jgi:hypothetical protein
MIFHVGFEVLTAVTMKNNFFWDVSPCDPVEAHGRSGGTYCLRLQGLRVNQVKNKQETNVSCLAYSSTPKIEPARSSEISACEFLPVKIYIRYCVL